MMSSDVINGQKINRQHYNFEIRHHNLNRGLMKTFLFHQIYKYKTSEYDENNSLSNNKTVVDAHGQAQEILTHLFDSKTKRV